MREGESKLPEGRFEPMVTWFINLFGPLMHLVLTDEIVEDKAPAPWRLQSECGCQKTTQGESKAGWKQVSSAQFSQVGSLTVLSPVGYLELILADRKLKAKQKTLWNKYNKLLLMSWCIWSLQWGARLVCYPGSKAIWKVAFISCWSWKRGLLAYWQLAVGISVFILDQIFNIIFIIKFLISLEKWLCSLAIAAMENLVIFIGL